MASDAVDLRALDQLDAMTRDLQAAAAPALAAALTPMLAEAVFRVPHRTGDLARHLRASASPTPTGAAGVVEVADSAPGGAAHEAVFIEYGHHTCAGEHVRWVPPQPFMRPAFDAAAPAVVQRFADGLSASLEQRT